MFIVKITFGPVFPLTRRTRKRLEWIDVWELALLKCVITTWRNFLWRSRAYSIIYDTLRLWSRFSPHNAPLAIRYPPDIRPRPLPGLIFSNIRPTSVTNWISTCGLNRFATCSLRSAECHRVKPTANLICVISVVIGAQFSWQLHSLQLNTLCGGLVLYNKGDEIYVAIACGWGDFLHKKWFLTFLCCACVFV